MSSSVQDLLETFDQLAEGDKRRAAAAILLRVRDFDIEPISDDEFVLSAEAVFLDLDERERARGES